MRVVLISENALDLNGLEGRFYGIEIPESAIREDGAILVEEVVKAMAIDLEIWPE